MTSDESPFVPVPATARAERAADVYAPKVAEVTQLTRTYPIRQPAEELDDFKVGVWATSLRRCRARLDEAIERKAPNTELLLGFSTLAAGASLSAWAGGVPLAPGLGFAFYVVSPMVAVGLGVAYLMRRGMTIKSASDLARETLRDLPDPDRAVDVGPS